MTYPAGNGRPMITPGQIQAVQGISPRLMADSHGWVIPRPDGSKTPCGGPTTCRECHLEWLAMQTTDRITMMEGWVINEGDEVLLLAPGNISEGYVTQIAAKLKERFPGVGFTILTGMTGLTVHRQDPQDNLRNH